MKLDIQFCNVWLLKITTLSFCVRGACKFEVL